MKLPFAIAVNDDWQLQPYWLHPCKVFGQGRSMGKIKFTPNRKEVGGWGPPEFPFPKRLQLLRKKYF